MLHNLGRCAGKHGSMREVMPSLDRRLYALAAVFQGEKIQSSPRSSAMTALGSGRGVFARSELFDMVPMPWVRRLVGRDGQGKPRKASRVSAGRPMPPPWLVRLWRRPWSCCPAVPGG